MSKLLEKMTEEDLDKLIVSWRDHPITQYINKIYDQALADNLTNPAVDSVVNISYTAGRLAGQNQVMYKFLNPVRWLKDEVEYNVLSEVTR